MASKMKIAFVTGNAGKLEEVRQLFDRFYGGNIPFDLISKDVDLVEIQDSMDRICMYKAKSAFKEINGPCFVEDTALCFNALGDLPGPYIKWFLKTVGPSGLYRMLSGFEDKSAKAVCTIGYVTQEGNQYLFRGHTTGTIVEPTVPETFGWDSCFKPDGYDITFAEMPKSEKNLISHRTKAMKAFKELLDKQLQKFKKTKS